MAVDLSPYHRRTARYSGAELEHRRSEWQKAHASTRISGAGDLTPFDHELIELHLAGKIGFKTYMRLQLEHMGDSRLTAEEARARQADRRQGKSRMRDVLRKRSSRMDGG